MEKQGKESKTEAPASGAVPKRHAIWRDRWVSELVRDPDKIPETVLIAGYLGDSPDENAVRVFLDSQLQLAIDVPADSIAHREEISRTFSPLGGSYLWIIASELRNCKYYRRQQAFSRPQ